MNSNGNRQYKSSSIIIIILIILIILIVIVILIIIMYNQATIADCDISWCIDPPLGWPKLMATAESLGILFRKKLEPHWTKTSSQTQVIKPINWSYRKQLKTSWGISPHFTIKMRPPSPLATPSWGSRPHPGAPQWCACQRRILGRTTSFSGRVLGWKQKGV